MVAGKGFEPLNVRVKVVCVATSPPSNVQGKNVTLFPMDFIISCFRGNVNLYMYLYMYMGGNVI